MSSNAIPLLPLGSSQKRIAPSASYRKKLPGQAVGRLVLSPELLVLIYRILVLLIISQVFIGTRQRHLIKGWLYVGVVLVLSLRLNVAGDAIYSIGARALRDFIKGVFT